MSQQPQNFHQTFRKGASKTSTGFIAYRVIRNLAETLGRVASVTRGYDVYYQAGTRPLIRRRQATNAVAGVFTLGTAVLGATELVARRSDAADANYGIQNAPTSDLGYNLVAFAITLPLVIRELKTGRSLIKKHPVSSFGKAMALTSILSATYVAALSARELYERREQWLPLITDDARLPWADTAEALRRN